MQHDAPRLVVNLSMLGDRPNGACIYARHCARAAEQAFATTIVSRNYQPSVSATRMDRPPKWFSALPRPFPALLNFTRNSTHPRPEGAIVYHPTHQGTWGGTNQIVTVLDMIAVHHPRQLPLQYQYYAHVLPRVLRTARAVFTLTDAVRHEVANHFGIEADRLHVVPCGVDTSRFNPGASLQDPARPYLLAVGASLPHKNILEVVRNHATWARHYVLKIVGASPSYRTALEREGRECRIVDRLAFISYVDEAGLVDLYRGCAALVYPSLHEGFGMPPLEAFACGRPAIVSDIPVHREVFGNAAIYVKLGVRSSWREAIAALGDEKATVHRLRHGAERVAGYSWERSAEALVRALLAVEPALARHD